jgi:putative PEP-CTERM system histidine kinase
VYHSAAVSVLGLYLLVVGFLGWLLTRLEIPETVFWTSLLVFVSAVGLAAILLSDNFRWRVKRFIGLHLYRSKYDYREQWINFTNRIGSRLSLDDLVRNVLAAVTNAVGAAHAALYVEDGGTYRLSGHQWLERPLPILDASLPLLARLTREGRPVPIDSPGVLDFMPAGSVAVPLAWQGRLTGVMLVGPERMRTPYTAEDLQFLVTAGEQAAGAIITARLSETLARAREFEAFHRLTSFVIHDVKNSIASLSLLTENALKHFEDPEFQRDAITTLSRTVERMQRLLARLSGPPDSASLRFQPVDVAELAREAARTAGGRGGVVTDIVAVPAVEADAEALVRVFQNLVKNAAEALPSGEGVVTVRTHADAEWVVFSVQDTGCGMSEDFVRTSLFAPFRSTKRGGWGIGLYQSQSIVEAHGGRIEVTSKEGNGSTFVVRLPLPRGQA